MERLRRSLHPLQWTLNLSGLWLFQPYIWLKALIVIHFVVLNSWPPWNIYLVVQWKLSGNSNIFNLDDMYIWKYLMSEVFSVIVSFMILSSRDRLIFILHEVCQGISKEQHKNLFRTTCIFLFYRIMKQTNRLALVYFCVEESMREPGGITFRTLLSIYKFLFDSWEVISLVTFISVLKIIHFTEINFIEGLLTKLETNDRGINRNKVYESIRRLLRLKNLLTKSTSFVICLFFLNMFADFVLVAIRLRKPRFEFSQKEFVLSRFDAVRLAMTVLEVMYLTFLTTNLCQDSQDNLEALEARIALTRQPRKWMFVIDKIQRAQGYEYQAWNLFPINKQILLSFTAALVSFTVLFSQLLGEVI